jgi:ABC-type nitrate/sulfonate/bicarbonate transport system substrate-binding protein
MVRLELNSCFNQVREEVMNILLTRRNLMVAAAIVAMMGTAPGQEIRKVSIGVSSASLPAAGARIAKEMGIFEKHGLAATVTPMDNASVATMGLISGSVDFATTSPTDVIVSRSRGQDLVAVTSVYRGFAGVLVLSKAVVDKLAISPTAPVSERLKALNGLVIASPSASSTYTFSARPAAEAVGARIKFTYMAQPAMMAALEASAVQGFIAGAPFYAAPVLKGTGVMWLNGPKREFPPEFTPANAVTLNTRREFAKTNLDLVQRVTAVFAEFAEAVNERPADVKAAISKLFPDIDAQSLELLFQTEASGFQPTPLTVEDMTREIAYLKSSGADVPQIDKLNPADMLLK